MKGSSHKAVKELDALKEDTSGGVRIGTRSSGRLTMTPSRMLRKAKLIQALPVPSNAQKTVSRRSRSHSPGNVVGLRTKRARLEKEKVKDKTPGSTPKTPASVESTPKSCVTSNTDESIDGTQVSAGIFTPQSAQNTPKSHVAITPGSAAKQHVAGTPGSTPKAQVVGTPGSAPGSTPKIRTRLATGSIQMNGTMTISAKQEKAELEQIMKQISKSDTPPSKTTTTGLKKRQSQSSMTPHDGLSTDHPPPKKRKIGRNNGSGEDNENDYFCWLCHKEGTLVCCELCPRVYHTKCLGLSAALPQAWVCPECEKIMRAECVDTRSKSMEMLTIEQLCTLLKYALDRMKHSGSEPFHKPVDQNAVPNYSDYIFHPMDISTLEKNIKQKMYGCTEALLADAKWILHNCIIYNGAHNKLTTSAKMIIKICKHEMNEIELCPDCYLNSCVRKNDDWFSETCRVPHTLVWAKLKGYPFWPSKALREVDGQVDVRFFGAHDRSWVPVSQCFLLSKNIPTSLHGKKNNGLDMAIEELNLHVNKLREKFGTFEYAPFRTPYDKTDTYKPFTIKPDTAVKPSSNWPTRENSPAKPNLTSPRKINSSMSGSQSIIRRSAITKTASALKNKYSALVSLKKLDITTEVAKTAIPLSGKSSVQATNVHIKEISEETVKEESKPESSGVIKSDSAETKRGEINKTGTAADNQSTGIDKKDTVSSKKSPASKAEVGTSDKGIKKTFVSSSLIEKLESKLKALDADNAEVSDGLKPENDKNSDGAECAGKEGMNDSTESKSEESVKESAVLKNSEEEKKLNEMINEDSGNELQKSTSDNQSSTENVDRGKVKTDSVPDQSDPKADDEKITPEEEKEFINELKDIAKESKDSYRKKLESMIKSCKEKLGMENNGLEEIDTTLSDLDESSDDDNEESEDESSGSEDEEEESSKDKLDESVSTEPMKPQDTVNKSTNETEAASVEVESETAEERNENEKSSVDLSKDNTKEIHEEIEETEEKGGKLSTSKETSAVDKSEKPLEINESNEKEELVLPESQEQQSKTKSQDASIVSEVDEMSKVNQEPKADVINLNDIDKIKQPVVVNEIVKPTPEPVLGVIVNCVTENDVVKEVSAVDKVLDPVSGMFSERTLEDEDSDVDRLVIDLEDETVDTSESRKVNQSELNRTKVNKEVNKSKSSEKKDNTLEISSDSSSASPKILGKTWKKRLVKTPSDRKLEKHGKSIMTPSPKDKNKVRKTMVAILHGESSFKSSVKTTSTPNVKSPVIKQRTGSGDSVGRLQKELCEVAQVSENTQSSKADEENEEVMDDDVMEINEEPMIGLIDDFSEQQLDLNSCLPDKNFSKPPMRSEDHVSESQSASKLAEKFSKKLLETIQKTMDEMCSEVLKEKSEGNTREILSEQLAQAKWNYCAELNELKHNFQLTLYEMKAGWESEKEMMMKGLSAKLNSEKELAIKETKKKQWCAHCGKEAIFYCCWNTSYCDYPCQQNHWPQHMHSCLQTNKDKNSNTSTSSSTAGSQSQSVSQSPVTIPVSIGPILNPSTSIPVSSSSSSEIDHLRRLQENLNAAMQRKEEERGESRPGVSPKFTTPMTSAAMQNIRQTGPQTIPMFNMQQPPNTNMMQQFQRARFIGQQQMMSVQQRGNLPTSQQINPRMVFSQPLVQQTIYPVQVAQQQQLSGAILFQNPQQNLMAYGMPPRPY